MVRANLTWFLRPALVILLLGFLSLPRPILGQMVPNSAKECAICHFRWLDQFYYEGRGTDLVEYQQEREAASEMICYSCHNGIIVDSRERFWAKRGHRVNMKPSDKVVIPPEMPLGENGEVTCATCHTAHGISDELRYQQTIYLRFPNRNSEMCIMCHVNKKGGLEMGNHPLGVTSLPIPTRILENYGRAGIQKDSVICETCHTVHGTSDKNLLVIPNKIGEEYSALLCESCHTPNPSLPGKGLGHGTHPVDQVSTLKLPKTWKNGQPLVTGPQKEVLCISCHSPHNAQKTSSLLVKDTAFPLCLECHPQEGLVIKTEHDMTISAPAEFKGESKIEAQTGLCSSCHRPHNAEKHRLWSRSLSGSGSDPGSQLCESCHNYRSCGQKKLVGKFSHPVNRELGKLSMKKSFPIFDSLGKPQTQGRIRCATCHDPHQWDPAKNQPGPSELTEGDQTNSFLRMANNKDSDFCLSCHGDKDKLIKTEHDLRITAKDEPNLAGQLCEEAGPCNACHLVHNAQGPRLWARFLPQANDQISAMCDSCHREKSCGEKKIIGTYTHPVGLDIEKAGGKTSLPLYNTQGLINEKAKLVTCASCHNVHQWSPDQKLAAPGKNIEGDGQNSFLRLVNDYESSLCRDCHKNKLAIAKTDHDLRFMAGQEINIRQETPRSSGLCGTCHLAHNGVAPLMFARQVDGQGDLANQLCTSCHGQKRCAEKKIISNHTHPMDKGIQAADGQTTLPLYLADGRKDALGKVACASCHNTHQWSPTEAIEGTGKDREGTVADSFLRLSMLPSPQLCEDCHQKEVHVQNSDHDMRLLAPEQKNSLNQTVQESGVCSPCHIIHNGPQKKMWARELPEIGGSHIITRECLSCHSSAKLAEKKSIVNYSHPIDLSLVEKEITTANLPLYSLSGESGNSTNNLMTCSTCHDPHQWKPALGDGAIEEAQAVKKSRQSIAKDKNQEGDITSSFLRLPNKEDTNLCLECHKDKQYLLKSEHDLAIFAKQDRNLQQKTVQESGICSSCHLVHNGPFKALLWARQVPAEQDFMLATCLSCHAQGKCAEKKSAFIGLHPSSFVYTGKVTQFQRMGSRDYQTYFPLYDKKGKKTPIGFVTCPTCHNVHQWDPVEKKYPAEDKNIEGDPRNSFLRNSGADFSICLDCHGFDAILRYKNYHVPTEWQKKYWKQGQMLH